MGHWFAFIELQALIVVHGLQLTGLVPQSRYLEQKYFPVKCCTVSLLLPMCDLVMMTWCKMQAWNPPSHDLNGTLMQILHETFPQGGDGDSHISDGGDHRTFQGLKFVFWYPLGC